MVMRSVFCLHICLCIFFCMFVFFLYFCAFFVLFYILCILCAVLVRALLLEPLGIVTRSVLGNCLRINCVINFDQTLDTTTLLLGQTPFCQLPQELFTLQCVTRDPNIFTQPTPQCQNSWSGSQLLNWADVQRMCGTCNKCCTHIFGVYTVYCTVYTQDILVVVVVVVVVVTKFKVQ